MSRAVTALRWTIAVVLGTQAAILELETLRAAPLKLHHVLVGAAELLGAVLLLVPASRRRGAMLLMATLVGVSLITVAGGHAPPWSFAVYGMSMFVVGRTDERHASLMRIS